MKKLSTLTALLALSMSAVAQNTETKHEQKEPFLVVEQMPEFPGGQDAMYKYLVKNIQYPADAKKDGLTGRVVVSFVVQSDGSLTDVKVVRGIPDAPSLNEEAIRVVKSMPKWNPGKQNGKAVAVVYNLPVSFVIEG